MIGQDEISQCAGLVDKLRERHDERNLLERLAYLPRTWRGVQRVGVINDEHARSRTGRQLRQRATFTCLRTTQLRCEEQPALLSHRTEQLIQRIHSERREQPVGVRERHAAHNGHGWTSLGNLSSKPLDARRRHPGERRHLVGRVVRETRCPAVDERVRAAGGGRTKLVAQNDVRETKRQHTFGTRRRCHPLVGARAGGCDTRFNLHERTAYAGTSALHAPVCRAVRDRRVPRAKKIRTEPHHVRGVGEVEGWELREAEAHGIRPSQHVVREQFVDDW